MYHDCYVTFDCATFNARSLLGTTVTEWIPWKTKRRPKTAINEQNAAGDGTLMVEYDVARMALTDLLSFKT